MEDLKFYKIKKEVEDFLKDYQSTVQKAEDKKAILFVLDKRAIDFLKDKSKELKIEYSHDSAFYKKHNINNIIKVINWEKPCHSFRTLVSYNWREINDKDKVFNVLEKELEKTFNKQKANVKKQLEKKEISEDYQKVVISKINSEYEKAKKEVAFMLKNKENIKEARISEYKRRKLYPRVDFIINKKRQTAVGLKTTSLNGIWFEELNEEQARNSNNKLAEFIENAINPFGDVYYIMK